MEANWLTTMSPFVKMELVMLSLLSLEEIHKVRPPQRVVLHKEGRRWVSDVPDRDLSEDIGYAVELKVPQQMMISAGRRRDSMNPAS